MSRLIGTICALLVLTACEPTMDEVIANNRAAVQAVFDKIVALDAVVATTPAVTEDRIDVGTQRVVLHGEHSNALFLQAEHVKAPDHAGSDATGATYASTIETCGQAMSGNARGVPVGVDMMLRDCGGAEFVFVLRSRVNVPAEIVELRSYRPGRFEGDVLLFRLSDAALLGGVSVSATNDDSIMARVDEAGIPKDLADRLESELSSNVFAAINAKLRQSVPGAVADAGS